MPSSHSSSSHSSSSHSSGGFSSHSSGGFSSHSSGSISSHSSSSHSSSWGSSSHSGSWSSSDSSWGSSRSSRSSRSSYSSPSRHSGTSRSSALKYRSHYVRDGSMQGSVIPRTRSNQPRGYSSGNHSSFTPIPHYCVHHNYYYFPFSWTDEATGQEYKKGYYDENGQYYENVVFRTDGMYKNVICQCEYCDTITKIDWTEGGPLICPQCGGTLKIISALDEYTQDPNYENLRKNADYVDYAYRNNYVNEEAYDDSGDGNPLKALLFVIGIIFALITFIALGSAGNSRSVNEDPYDANHRAEDGWVYMGNGTWVQYRPYNDQNDQGGNSGSSQPLTNPEIFGEVLWLRETEPGVFAFANDDDYDRELFWNEDEEAYLDEDSGVWIWYNNNVDPPLWQYWYEPISGDFGGFGWMGYEDGIWYIEASRGNWIEVPEEYDVSPLWHMEYASVPENETPDEPDSPDATAEDLLIFGEVLRLSEREPGVYVLTDGSDGDKVLFWHDAEQSYYDEDSELWVWYNTRVDPPLWQYWYEPISGDFGDYGWMEYEDGVWYIEEAAGDWIPLPEEYDTNPLWHFETEGVG